MKFVPGKVIEEFEVKGKKVRFRFLKSSDLNQLHKYINDLIAEKLYIGGQKRISKEKEREWLKDNLKATKKDSRISVLVEIDGKIVGNSGSTKKQLDASEHVCTIGISLSKIARGMGIGKRLLNKVLELSKSMLKCEIAELTCYEENKIAMKLYKRCGFKVCGKIPKGCNYYGRYIDEVILYREL